MIPHVKPETDKKELDAVNRVIASGWMGRGPEAEALEKEFSDYISPEGKHYYCLFTNSCTSALKMAYKWAKEQGYTGISYPTNTFCATYSAAAEMGLDLYPRICQNGGVKEYKCQDKQQLKSLTFVNGAEQPLIIGQATNQNSAQETVSTKVNWVKHYHQRLKLSQENEEVLLQSLRELDQKTSTNEDTGQPISGSEEIGAEQQNAKFVELQLKNTAIGRIISNGLAKITNILGKEKIGNSCVESATSPKIAQVNVAYGGIADTSECLIEDSAHRIEKDDFLRAKIRCYSFHPNKNMTSGGGGMFVTDDKDIYEWALLQINDGIKRTSFGRFDYTVEAYAGGYEGFDINAAIGRVQLKKLPDFQNKRNELVKRYNEAFNTNWTGNHIFPLYLKDYDEVKKCIVELEKQGVSCKSHYPGSNVMTLPLFPSLSFEDQNEVIEKVKTLCREKSILL